MEVAKSPILDVSHLCVEFVSRRGTLRAIDDLSFQVYPGEILGIIGESGAGKSVTGAAIIGLLEPPGRIVGGTIFLDGRRIDDLPERQLRHIRGAQIGSIFQDSLSSLNPLFTVGRQLVDTIRALTAANPNAARRRAIDLLDEVGIAAPEKRVDDYPHQFSGGMRQRVVIALALCGNPKLIIADEPTTALDVSVQAQIIALLKHVSALHDTAIILITHDMGVISETADRVAVMYAGRLAETGSTQEIVNKPRHPYTSGLMGSIPRIGATNKQLTQIAGSMPRLTAIPAGCAFNPRCPQAFDRCRIERPPLFASGANITACWLYAADDHAHHNGR